MVASLGMPKAATNAAQAPRLPCSDRSARSCRWPGPGGLDPSDADPSLFRYRAARGVSDGTLANSRCQDYRKLEDRMNMIVNVFRTRHDDQSLFEAPFDPHQTREIQAGRVPAGKL